MTTMTQSNPTPAVTSAARNAARQAGQLALVGAAGVLAICPIQGWTVTAAVLSTVLLVASLAMEHQG